MSDRFHRNAGRKQGSLLSSAPARPAVRKAAADRPATSLLGQAIERERAVRDHREAAAVRKALAKPLSADADPRMDKAEIDGLFDGWDDDHATASAAPRARPAETRPAVLSPDNDAGEVPPADENAWRPLIDPMALVGGLLRSRAIIAATTVLGALAGVAVALSTPKHYVSFAELLVDPRNLQIVERDLTGNGYMASEATLSLIENQVRIMRSGPVLAKVVDTLRLDSDPEFNGAGNSFGPGALLSALRGLLTSNDAPAAGAARTALTIEKLAAAVDVERSGKTFIVEISATTREPEKSALVANALVDVYLDKAASLQAENAGRATGELSGRLDDLRKAVEAAERKVETFKSENDLVDAKGVLIGDDELVRLNDQLTVARARTLELNAKASSARELDADAVISGGLPEQVASAALNQLRGQYATLAQEVAKATVRLGPRHPERQAAEAQLADARSSIERELRRVVASIQVELKRAVQYEQELSARLAQMKSRQGVVSDKLVELREIERDAAAKRAVYESYLLRARETGEQQGVNTGNISVVSRATPAIEPTGPSRTVIAVLGTVLGFLAGVGIGLARGAISALRPGGAPTGGPRRRSAPVPASRPVQAPAPVPLSATPAFVSAMADAAVPAPSATAPQAGPAVQPPYAPAGVAQMPPPQPVTPYVPSAYAPWPPAHVPQVYGYVAPPQPVLQPVFAPAWPQPVWPHPQHWQAAPPPFSPSPAPPPTDAADDEKVDGLRRGLARFRESVEDLAAARMRRRG